MTPRLPLVTAALAAAALVSPASAAPAQPGLWSGVHGLFYHGSAGAEGVVVWPDLTTSWCAGSVGGTDGEITCTGAVSFSVDGCRGSTVWGVSMSIVCTAGTTKVEAVAVATASSGAFTGTVSYQQLPAIQ